MKHLFLLGALVLTAALVAYGASRAHGAATAAATIHVVEHANTDAVTDTGGKGDTAGDVLTFANPVFDAADRARSGRDQGLCVRTVAGSAWECWWTVFLAGGQITVEGPFYDKKGSALAITGGTKAYAGARGWMDLKSRAGGTKYDFVYHLVG